MNSVEALVSSLGLTPHPEGGFFRETYRAPAKLAGTQRSVSTAILYLLGAGQRSKLHRIDADEVWHFHRGDPLEVIELEPSRVKVTRLSADHPQHVVPAGVWFGARPTGGFSLVGCTVAPGFEFEHFELADRAALLAQFPHARDVIEALT
ncbi:MAG: cupin domain-containing protein [Archangium sp.]|nr:cupin domain-containing protein [Archangium sp.]